MLIERDQVDLAAQAVQQLNQAFGVGSRIVDIPDQDILKGDCLLGFLGIIATGRD